MSSLLSKASVYIKNSLLTLPVFIAVVIWFITSTGNTGVDYITSYLGYETVGGRNLAEDARVSEKVLWLETLSNYGVPALPQVLQVVFGYMILASEDEKKRRGWIVAWAMSFAVDFWWDGIFRLSDYPFEWSFAWFQYAFDALVVKSFFVYTLGSEVGWSISLALIGELLDDALSKLFSTSYLVIFYFGVVIVMTVDGVRAIWLAIKGDVSGLKHLRERADDLAKAKGITEFTSKINSPGSGRGGGGGGGGPRNEPPRQDNRPPQRPEPTYIPADGQRDYHKIGQSKDTNEPTPTIPPTRTPPPTSGHIPKPRPIPQG